MNLRLVISVGALLASTVLTEGNPSIVWSGPQDILMGVAPGQGGYSSWWLDLDGNGVDDFLFEYDTDFEIFPSTSSMTIVGPYPEPGFLASQPLTQGTDISESPQTPLEWSEDEQLLVGWFVLEGGGYAAYGPWAGVSAYMGVSFEDEGNTYYGWISISASGAPGDVWDYAYINEWAYNSVPGEGMLAGQVPEPATGALFLLGTGTVLFLRSFRRGRKVEKKG